jgi:citrate lyase subunit beta/citryl-CoA lyase
MTTLLRSVLFVPGTRSDRFEKALAAGADAVILDLEDAVAPSRKAEARDTVAAFLSTAPASPPLVFVRVNAPDSPWIADDLARAADFAGIHGLVVPKVESPGHLETVARHAPDRRVIPLIESPRAVLNAPAIAAADAHVLALLFGAEDLTADLGISRTIDGEELLFGRSQVVLAAASVGAEAIDAVFTDVADADRLQADARRARALGFRGKMAIHPKQVPVINRAFSPTAEEVARARQVVSSFEAAGDEGVTRLGDEMIEAPVVARARRIIARAESISRARH